MSLPDADVEYLDAYAQAQGLHSRSAAPFQTFLAAGATGLATDSKAQADRVRSVAVERVGERVGVLASADLAHLDEALRIHLAL